MKKSPPKAEFSRKSVVRLNDSVATKRRHSETKALPDSIASTPTQSKKGKEDQPGFHTCTYPRLQDLSSSVSLLTYFAGSSTSSSPNLTRGVKRGRLSADRDIEQALEDQKRCIPHRTNSSSMATPPADTSATGKETYAQRRQLSSRTVGNESNLEIRNQLARLVNMSATQQDLSPRTRPSSEGSIRHRMTASATSSTNYRSSIRSLQVPDTHIVAVRNDHLPFHPTGSLGYPGTLTSPGGPSLLNRYENLVTAIQPAASARRLLPPSPHLSTFHHRRTAEALAYQNALSQMMASSRMTVPSLPRFEASRYNLQSEMLHSLSRRHDMSVNLPGAALAFNSPRSYSSASNFDTGASEDVIHGRHEEQRSKRQVPSLTSRCFYLPSCDEDRLSEYQILLRKQIEFFEADSNDVNVVVPGRKKGVVLGQVGIRCIHCAQLPVHLRSPGTAYFPSKLLGVYQAAQNLAKSHLCGHCETVPREIRTELVALRQCRSTSGYGGKQYWAVGARALGVSEVDGVLRFSS